MKKRRRTLKSIVSIIMTFILIIVSGCSCKGCNGDKDGEWTPQDKPMLPPINQTELTLDKTNLDMIVGDYQTLVADYKNQEDLSLQWTSENSEIASVTDKGLVEAINEGTTKITCTYGNDSVSCEVKVSFGDSLPVTELSVGGYDTFRINVNDKYDFEPRILFRNRYFYDGQFSYSSSNESVAKFEEGKLKPLQKGTTFVTVTGTWKGKDKSYSAELEKIVKVDIIDDINIKLQDYQTDMIELYTTANFDGQTYKNQTQIIPSAYINGTKLENVQFSINCGSDKIRFEGSTLTAEKYGETTLIISFEKDGEIFIKQYFVKIIRPDAKILTKEIKYFSSYDGTYRDNEDLYKKKNLSQFIFGNDSDERLTEAFDNDTKEALQIESNRVLGIAAEKDKTYKKTIFVATDKESYILTVNVYGMFIWEASDLKVFVRTEESPEYNGYVELGRDVEAYGYNHPEHAINFDNLNQGESKCNYDGYKGIFDGKGNSISNLTTKRAGLFATITDATIKNIAFINAKTSGSQPSLFTMRACRATMENVYISISEMGTPSVSYGAKVIACHMIEKGTYSNVVIEMQLENNFTKATQYATFGAYDLEKPTFSNCLSISKFPVGSWVINGPRKQIVGGENTPDASLNNWETLLLSSDSDNIKKERYSGVRAYDNQQAMMADYDNVKAMLDTFSNEYWTVNSNGISWGASEQAQSGEILLTLGEMTGKYVTGLDNQTLTKEAGETVTLPTGLKCVGYNFIGWRNAATKQSVPNPFTYDGTGLILEAVWEIDDSAISAPIK